MRKAQHISEPELQFGASRHVDIRFGLRDYGPFDIDQPSQPGTIRLGVVGTPETTDQLREWFSRMEQGIEAKESKFENRYVDFPGFGRDQKLCSPIQIDDAAIRTVPPRELKRIESLDNVNQAIEEAAEIFSSELRDLAENKNVDVLLCAPPDSIYKLRNEPRPHEQREKVSDNEGAGSNGQEDYYGYRVDFHDLLKAQSLILSCPTQLIWSPTYTGEKIDVVGQKTYPLQDEATRAWNLYVALYYKAGGIPWRLVRDRTDFETCFVGVSFYKSLDQKRAHGSVAQIFNERGEGLIMRGGPAERSSEDRQLHLSGDDSGNLLGKTLQTYRREHGHSPARVVLHKTSPFSEAEKEGFWAAAEEWMIDYMDLLHVRRSKTRLFRKEYHPPLRGTLLSLDRSHNYLYTVGSINFYQMIFSHHVPKTLQFNVVDSGTSPRRLAEELLKLTKMNWNNTQISQMMPVTIEAARHVGALMKYADREGLPAQVLSPKYSYYM